MTVIGNAYADGVSRSPTHLRRAAIADVTEATHSPQFAASRLASDNTLAFRLVQPAE